MSTSPPTSGRVRLVLAGALGAACLLCAIFAWTTRDSMANLPFVNGRADSQSSLVDQRPWQTAQALAGLAVTSEEFEFAHEAERLADHEVNQAFDSALRQATVQRHPLTGDALALSKKLDRLQALVNEDQHHVDLLSKPDKKPSEDSVDDDLDIAKAQLGLDADELNDVRQDLARAEGDQRVRIKQELAAHQALVAKYEAQTAKQDRPAVAAAHQYGSVARRIKAWFDQRTRYALLEEALRNAQVRAALLIAQHNKLESQAAPLIDVNDKTARLASLKSKSARSQLLSIFDDRIQTEQQLASVYTRWSAQVLLQHRIVFHLLLQSLALLAFILLCLVLIDILIRRAIDHPGLDRRRMHTLHVISKVALQLVAIAAILLVVFGLPNQTPAILGLATAGITVALQDFIVAFFGWFVLMGKNGIRLGDWVEIDGVGGEVIEIGLFRTALLETGNWTDKGHPTGRRVTFVNSFAVKGQYFNFSTTGQWLWDEIKVNVPTAAADSYALIESIHKSVTAETQEEATLAEQEWKHATMQNNVNQFTAIPAVDLRPGATGIDIIVRYVTRASKRFEVRNRLYQRVIELMQKGSNAQ